MILDKLENFSKHGIDLKVNFTHLSKEHFTKGKFEFGDRQNFGIGLEYETQTAEGALWEAHRRFLDIHIILVGEEIVHISDIATMTPTNEYQEDYQLFEGQPQQSIHLKPGYFLVLSPQEVHRTTIMRGKSTLVQKHVYKCLL